MQLVQILAGIISLGLSITLIVLFILMYINTQKIRKCICKE